MLDNVSIPLYNFTMHPLDGAYQRVRRAGIHLTNLNRRTRIICQTKSDGVVIERKPQTFLLPNGRRVKGVLGKATFTIEPMSPIISILIGETIYNLRSALDYLVYDLAQLDAQKVIKGT